MNDELNIALYLTDDTTEVQVELFYLWYERGLTYTEPHRTITRRG